MSATYHNPHDATTLLAARAAIKACRRTVKAWKRSRTEACDFFDQHPGRRHALFITRREDYVGLFSDNADSMDSAASRAWRSAGIAVAVQYIPNAHAVARLLFPVQHGPLRCDGTELEARAVFDAKWRDESGAVARDVFWTGGTWREVTVQ